MAESQMRKGVLELMVLAALDHEPSYGGALRDTLVRASGAELSAGTLYPLLSRLRTNGTLATHWEESPVGPPRKVYSLTDAGAARLTTLRDDWYTLTRAVAAILEGH